MTPTPTFMALCAFTLAFAVPAAAATFGAATTYSASVEGQVDQSVSDSTEPIGLSTPTSGGGEAAARAGAGYLGVKATEGGQASASFRKTLSASVSTVGGEPYTGGAYLSLLFYTTGNFVGDGGSLGIGADTDVDESDAFISNDPETYLSEPSFETNEQLSNRAFVEDGTAYLGLTSRLGLGGADVTWQAETYFEVGGANTSVSNFLGFDLAFVPGAPFAFEVEMTAFPNVGASLSGGVDFYGTSTLTGVAVTLDDPDAEIESFTVTADGGATDLVALAEANAAALLAPVPVPAPIALLATALAGLVALRGRGRPRPARQ